VPENTHVFVLWYAAEFVSQQTTQSATFNS